MPNFDGKGPLKRGRVTGRGRGAGMQNAGGNREQDIDPESPDKKKEQAE